MAEPEDEVVVTPDNRITGCRGRTLIALIVLAVLLLLLTAMLVRGVFTGAPQLPPPKTAAAGSVRPAEPLWG